MFLVTFCDVCTQVQIISNFLFVCQSGGWFAYALILDKFSQLTTDTQKKHTDRRTNVNLKLAPPEVGQLKQNNNFISFHT